LSGQQQTMKQTE